MMLSCMIEGRVIFRMNDYPALIEGRVILVMLSCIEGGDLVNDYPALIEGRVIFRMNDYPALIEGG